MSQYQMVSMTTEDISKDRMESERHLLGLQLDYGANPPANSSQEKNRGIINRVCGLDLQAGEMNFALPRNLRSEEQIDIPAEVDAKLGKFSFSFRGQPRTAISGHVSFETLEEIDVYTTENGLVLVNNGPGPNTTKMDVTVHNIVIVRLGREMKNDVNPRVYRQVSRTVAGQRAYAISGLDYLTEVAAGNGPQTFFGRRGQSRVVQNDRIVRIWHPLKLGTWNADTAMG